MVRKSSNLLSLDRPTVRADGHGYVLGDQTVEGFGDRTELSIEHRTIIARLSRRYTPKALTPQQQELLRAFDEGAPQAPSAVLSSFSSNEADLQDISVSGFLQELKSDELRYVARPGLHPLIKGRSYPLTTGEVAKLCRASQRQVRHWADSGMIPSYRIDGIRRFFSAGLIRAMVLAKGDNYEVSALAAIARGGKRGERLLRLIGATVAGQALRRTTEPAAALLGAAGSGLVVNASQWSRVLSTPADPTQEDEKSTPAHDSPIIPWQLAEGLKWIAAPGNAFHDLDVDLDEGLLMLRTAIDAKEPLEIVTACALLASAGQWASPWQELPKEEIDETREMLLCAWQFLQTSARPNGKGTDEETASRVRLTNVVREWRSSVHSRLTELPTSPHTATDATASPTGRRRKR